MSLFAGCRAVRIKISLFLCPLTPASLKHLQPSRLSRAALGESGRELLGFHRRSIQRKTSRGKRLSVFFVTVMLVTLESDTVSSFLRGSRGVLLRSLMTKQKVEAVAGGVETISVLLRSMKTCSVSLRVFGPCGSHHSCPVTGPRAGRKLPAAHQRV